jgi:hypothetical protein
MTGKARFVLSCLFEDISLLALYRIESIFKTKRQG